MLLEALAGCAAVTLRSVAAAMGLALRSATVHVVGHWDARGTLGVDREVPVGFTDIEVRIEVDADADEAALARCRGHRALLRRRPDPAGAHPGHGHPRLTLPTAGPAVSRR